MGVDHSSKLPYNKKKIYNIRKNATLFNLLIGIISHVEELKECIDRQVVITKKNLEVSGYVS